MFSTPELYCHAKRNHKIFWAQVFRQPSPGELGTRETKHADLHCGIVFVKRLFSRLGMKFDASSWDYYDQKNSSDFTALAASFWGSDAKQLLTELHYSNTIFKKAPVGYRTRVLPFSATLYTL